MDYIFIVGNLICVYAILAASLNLVMGFGGLFTVAHAAFFGIGAYVFALCVTSLGLPFGIALLLGFLAAAAGSIVLSAPSLRLSAEYLMLATFAVQIIASSLFTNLEITGGPAGIRAIPLPGFLGPSSTIGAEVLAVVLLVTAISWYVMNSMVRSPFGRVLKAVREDEWAAVALGKNVVTFKLAAFAIGCGFAGLAGGLYASVLSYINPDSFTMYVSFSVVVMVLLGGIGHPLGGVLGAIVLTLLQELLRIVLPSTIGAPLAQVIFGIVLVVVIMKMPQGILSEHIAGHTKFNDDILRKRGGARGRSLGGMVATRRDGLADAGNSAIEIENASKSYGGVHAVAGASLDVAVGEIIGIIGPNGAGKTTMFDILAGAVRPDTGELRVFGKRASGLPIHALARRGIGRLFQDARPLGNLSVLDNVLVGFPRVKRENPLLSWLPIDRDAEKRRLAKALDYLEFIGLGQHAGERAATLSFGQQKLLAFARLLAQEARIWLLDEPAAGVDPAMREELRAVIKRCRDELGVTVLVVEHNMEFLKELAGRVVFMAEGKILKIGSLEEISGDPELNQLYLGA